MENECLYVCMYIEYAACSRKPRLHVSLLLFNDALPYIFKGYTASKERLNVSNELERMWKEIAVVCFFTLSQNFIRRGQTKSTLAVHRIEIRTPGLPITEHEG
jgi:hypothetical protein